MPRQGYYSYSNHSEAKDVKKEELSASSSRGGWKNFNFEAKAFIANRANLPKFKITMKPSYIKDRSLAIPVEFAKNNLKMSEAPVYLTIWKEKPIWQVKYKTCSGDNYPTKYKFQDGWRKFVSKNHLKVGDSCEFVWTNANPLKFTVVVERAAEKLLSKSKAEKTFIPEAAKDGAASSNFDNIFNPPITVLEEITPGEIASGSREKSPTDSDVLLKFFAAHEDMQLSLLKIPEKLRLFLYSCLANLINLLKSFPICELKLKHMGAIVDNLETFRRCSISNSWLDEVDACFNQQKYFDAAKLQALTDLEDQYAKSNNTLKKKISLLSSHMELLKHEMKLSEANLLHVRTQKKELVGGTSFSDGFFPLCF